MVRIGYLYDKIISLENLREADRKAQRGKKRQRDVIEHNKNREENIQMLHIILKERRYKTSEYFDFAIYEPKKRNISRLSYYPNRIVHHAIMNYLEPILTKCFISQTYSCIKKRGIHKALGTLKGYLANKEETKYCLKLDIAKFYPSINKELLKQKLRNKFKDKDLLNLLDEIIDSYSNGLPLGNLLSQWFGNFYLNSFDHWLKQDKKVSRYLKYCDDLVILHSDKAYLHSLRREIQEYLQDNLGLQLSNYQVFPVESRGIDFLGYKSYHDKILMRKSIKNRFKRMVRKYRNTKSIWSYYGWLCHSNSINLWNRYLN